MRITVESVARLPVDRQPHEIVERKGIGHPDTLADGIAEAVSRAYARYCLREFGVVANHWVDKCVLIGGESDLSFGHGELIRPYHVLVVGKATEAVGDHVIPIEELARQAVHEYLSGVLCGFQPERHVQVELRLNSAVGAGRPSRWYRPADITELPDPTRLTANDAVCCSGYAPLSMVERLVLGLEQQITRGELAAAFPETGTDVKILAVRHHDTVDVVGCVPFLASRTPSRAAYDRRKAQLREAMTDYARRAYPGGTVRVRINTRDDETVYLTTLGSAADTGDVGVVGRGNRANGLITPMRPMSIEAPAGKNPIYHTGKLYTVLAQRIATDVAQLVEYAADVHLTSSTGRPLTEPDAVAVELIGGDQAELDAVRDKVTAIASTHVASVTSLVNEFAAGVTLW